MKRAMIGGLTAILVLCIAGMVMGSESEGGGSAHGARFGKAEIFQIVNFILLLILLLYAYRRYAGGGFEKRSHHIKMAIEEAQQAKRRAEAQYQEYRSRLEKVDKDIAEILEKAQQQGAKEHEQILSEARAQAEKMLHQAELTARQEVAYAKQQLREETVALAAHMALEVLNNIVTQEDHARLVDTYVKKLGEIN